MTKWARQRRAGAGALVAIGLVASATISSPARAEGDPASAPVERAQAESVTEPAFDTPEPEPVERVAQQRNVTSLVPARLLDSRTGPAAATTDGLFQGGGPVAAGSTTELVVASRGGVPSDASAVLLNVTAVNPTDTGFLTIFPCGEDQPLASNVNYRAGDVVPNAVLAKVGTGGAVCIFSRVSTNLVIDVNGFVSAESATTSLVPARLLETRDRDGATTVDGDFQGIGALDDGTTLELTVADRGGVPRGATAVLLNVTAIAPDGVGFLTIFPCGEPQPLASNVNYGPGDVVANAVLAQVGTNGQVCIYTQSDTDVVVDVNGYVGADAGTTPVVPARLLETRSTPGAATVDGQFQGQGAIAGQATIELDIAGRGNVPETGVGAVMLNVTAVNPQGRGYLTVFPCGQDRPLASNVNYIAGDSVANAVLARIGNAGKVCIYSQAATHIVIDVNGWFDLPPNQPETDVMVLEDESFEVETVSGGATEPNPIDPELNADPEVVRITTDQPMFDVGDTVVLSKPSGEPYYGEVTSVDGAEVVAEEVALGQVIPMLDLSLEANTVTGEFTTFVGADAVNNPEIDESEELSNKSSPATGGCTTGGGASFSATAAADAGTFVFDISFNIFEGLTAARIGFNPSLSAEITAEVSATAGCTWDKTVFTKELPKIKFFIGPIPVWIDHELSVGIRAAVEASASGSITLGASASAFAGIVYDETGWNRQSNITLETTREITQDAEISATISVPVIGYEAKVYGAVGFNVEVAANLKLTYRPFAKKYLVLTTFVDLGAGIVIELDLELFELRWEHEFGRVTLWGPHELWSLSQAVTQCEGKTIPAAQCRALVDLWESAGGPNWYNADTWVTDTDPCGVDIGIAIVFRWEGITCVNGNVTEINLDGFDFSGGGPGGLTGPITSDIGDISTLQVLSLRNGFVESIPTSIGNLTQLRELSLRDTGLRSVPSAIGNLTALQELDLGDNPLTSLPPTIGNLDQVTRFIVNDAQLTTMPSQINDMTALRVAAFDRNPFVSFPYIGDLTNLEELQLDGPSGAVGTLTDLPPGIGQLPNIELLIFSFQPLSADITDEVRAMRDNNTVELNDGIVIDFTGIAGCPTITDSELAAWFSTRGDWDAAC